MNNKALRVLVCLTIIFMLLPVKQVYAYADLTNYNTYIEKLDITYKDLSLTPEELAVIEDLQQNGGITYGMHNNDYTVFMIFQQIGKAFGIEAKPVVYDDYADLLNDVAVGNIDFTGSMIPTEERLEIFDFTTSTHKDKTFLFITHENLDLMNSNKKDDSRVIRVGHPDGFALTGLLSEEFKETFNYELLSISSIDEAVSFIQYGKVDMVFGDITWYGELVAIENYMAIDYSDYIDTYFSGNLTKKGTNKELIRAINKMYAETNALVELQTQIENYYQDAALYALREKYYDVLDHDQVNTILVSEYRPYVYKVDDAYTGFFVDLFKELFDAFDLKYELIPSEYVEAEVLSNEDFTVALPVFVTTETREKYNLTIPIAESNMVVITIPDNSSDYFTDVDDLSIQKVGTVGSNYMHNYINDVLLNPDNVVYYADLDTLVNAINTGEVKFGVVPYEEFNKFAIENKIINIHVLSAMHLPKYTIAFGTPKTERGLKYEVILSSALSIMNYSDLENKYLSTIPEIEAVFQYKNEVLNSTIHMVIFSAMFAITVLCALIYINQKRANTDYLTKLRNRRTLEYYIEAIKNRVNMSIAYIDLDNFKIINDVYGHHYGDKVLIYIAQELLKFSKYSRAFRVGGDEFVIVYNNNKIDFNNDIKTILDKTIKIEQTDIKVEGSVGNLNLGNYSYLDVVDIINLTDYAMLTAKRRGKNIVIEISDVLVKNYIAIRDLRKALETEQYEENVKIFMEPIKDDNKIHGFCVVAKCHHKDNYISYEEIKIHMTNKLVLNKIVLLVFEKLCQSINYITENTKVKMGYIYELETESVNKQNIQSLATILEEYKIDPQAITLRVDPILFSGAKGASYVRLLNQLGCKISIDFYKITGEALLYLNYLDFAFVELDLLGLVKFLKHMDLLDDDAVYKELSNNLAVKKVIEVCNSFEIGLLLYTYNDKFTDLAMEFLSGKLDTKIYYIEKDSLTLLDDYLASFKV